MKILLYVFLGLIALFTGGCSLAFLLSSVFGPNDPYTNLGQIYPIILLGFAMAAMAIATIVLANKLARAKAAGKPITPVQRLVLTLLTTALSFVVAGGLSVLIFGGSILLALVLAGVAGAVSFALFSPKADPAAK